MVRRWIGLLVVAVVAASSSARAQSAPAPGQGPSPQPLPAAQPRAEATASQRTDDERAPLRAPLAIVGGSLSLLGIGTLFAAGITQIVAASEASRLDRECPQKRCVEGTRGGDAYETARDSAKGAEILLGVGLPLVSAGLMMTLFAASLGPAERVRAVPVVSARGGGARVAVSF